MRCCCWPSPSIDLLIQATVNNAFGVAFRFNMYSTTLNLSIKARYSRNFLVLTSEDFKNAIDKALGDSWVALSFPRLVIPAIIFGLFVISDRYQNSIFRFELTAQLCTLMLDLN
ncbi:hypothetical protein ACP70R_030791 [Stipagrostis hirtigluma subsp. patula]